jgi:very-short-patch-repair endonuclease
MTLAEKILWQALRKLDLNIRRQSPVGRYVADFIHHGSKLIIEVDGYWHDQPEGQQRDLERDAWFEGQGYRVMRFPNGDVHMGLSAVVESVRVAIQQSPPTPTLPPSRGKGE